jgi:hypothetical protein
MQLVRMLAMLAMLATCKGQILWLVFSLNKLMVVNHLTS